IIDRDNWKLYELFSASPVNKGASWKADGGAVFNLNSNAARPAGWTSADAAGLPIFPGLIRYDEVHELKEIAHALRFTAQRTLWARSKALTLKSCAWEQLRAGKLPCVAGGKC